MKGTLEAKRPGRLGPRPLPSCSWVSQGRLSPPPFTGTVPPSPCASQGLLRPRAMAAQVREQKFLRTEHGQAAAICRGQ